MSRILVTGASGFVGRALSEQLQRLGMKSLPLHEAHPLAFLLLYGLY